MASCKDCVHVEVCISYLREAYKRAHLATPDLNSFLSLRCDDCEHFKDRSRFVELPCYVGDTVYEIVERKASGKWVPIIVSHVVGAIEVCKNGTIGFRCGTTIWISADSAFLTREAAEQALKERENGA